MNPSIQPERVRTLNQKEFKEREYVLYWMQASQRIRDNQALSCAADYANKRDKPLIILFVLTEDYPEAAARHYHFMLEGLRDAQKEAQALGIKLLVRIGSVIKTVLFFAQQADCLIFDRGYTRIQKKWRSSIADEADIPVFEIDCNVVVPVETASHKEEYTAGTFRPRIHKHIDRFLLPVRTPKLIRSSINLDFISEDLADIDNVIKKLKINHSVLPVKSFQGGTKEAHKRLESFIKYKLDRYALDKNDPALDGVSQLSPYLHFGQISPISVALAVKSTYSPGTEVFLEELIIRRELAFNFVHYNPAYDHFESLPNWAVNSLELHKSDAREFIYTEDELENARTHDIYWNSAQNQMRITGWMHGYMRMYWGKKILEWNKNPRHAFDIALRLNNRYQLDGRDPNSFAGIAWCFGKHDRAWFERDIFGKIRYMNSNGLKRKFDIGLYIQKMAKITSKPDLHSSKDNGKAGCF